ATATAPDIFLNLIPVAAASPQIVVSVGVLVVRVVEDHCVRIGHGVLCLYLAEKVSNDERSHQRRYQKPNFVVDRFHFGITGNLRDEFITWILRRGREEVPQSQRFPMT